MNHSRFGLCESVFNLLFLKENGLLINRFRWHAAHADHQNGVGQGVKVIGHTGGRKCAETAREAACICVRLASALRAAVNRQSACKAGVVQW